jgi:predicted amidophosphoribosyltransferase
VVGGRDGCQAVFDELTARAYADVAYASVRDLAFDAYCMQHLDSYCRSAKSYAAHLTRLCCGLEYQGDPKVYEAIQKWLNGAVKIEKPPVLAQ